MIEMESVISTTATIRVVRCLEVLARRTTASVLGLRFLIKLSVLEEEETS